MIKKICREISWTVGVYYFELKYFAVECFERARKRVSDWWTGG